MRTRVKRITGKDLSAPFQLLWLALNLSAAIIVGFLPDLLKSEVSTVDQLLLGIVTFLSLTLIQTLFKVIKLEGYARTEEEKWLVKVETDQRIHNIRAHINKILEANYGPNDKFVNHFRSQIQHLEAKLRDAAEQRELRVTDLHFNSAAQVLSAFDTDTDRIYRYTWPILPGETLFDAPTWRHFFRITKDLVANKSISEVRILIILPSWDLAGEPHIKMLLDFFKATDRMECKLTLLKTFDAVADDYAISRSDDDFGIFGKTLLYITEEDEPPVGTYS